MASLWGETSHVLWELLSSLSLISTQSESDVYGVAITLRSSQKRENNLMENVMKNLYASTPLKLWMKRLPFAG